MRTHNVPRFVRKRFHPATLWGCALCLLVASSCATTARHPAKAPGADGPSPTLTACVFRLPLTDGDGQPVGSQRREELLDLVYAEFGGYTIEGEGEGAYRRHDTGQKQVERMLKVLVAVEGTEGVSRLRDLVARIGRELDQETMYFEVSTGSVVELVPSGE